MARLGPTKLLQNCRQVVPKELAEHGQAPRTAGMRPRMKRHATKDCVNKTILDGEWLRMVRRVTKIQADQLMNQFESTKQ